MTAVRKKAAPKTKKHNPGAFLDLPPAASSYDGAAVVIMPLPLEESVSYGGGASEGPKAIIEASQQVELYDPRHQCEPAMMYGVHTLPGPKWAGSRGKKLDVAAVIDKIADETATHLTNGKFPVGLGGEHTVSFGVAKGVARVKGQFTLVHIDAHADLRDSYENNPYSHACVVRRIAEMPECESVLQLGIRSTSQDQAEFVVETRPLVRTWFAWDMHRDKTWQKQLRQAVKNKRVFFTFDVDGLDPSIVPATGTPEPDGLTWRQLMKIVKITAKHAAEVVAMDCVELAPVPGLHYADFAVARAVYEIITTFQKSKTR